jgi:hypothetical protein
MRNKIIHSILFLLVFASAQAQNRGNEWINYSQQYFTFSIHQNGVYRIDYNTLLNAGVPLGSFDPRSFQVFARGEEQPIFVRNEKSGLFNPGDYIELYAEKNTGWFDSEMYSNPLKHPNPNYSLINDTITYYITWNNSINNKRFTNFQETSFSSYTPAPYFWFTSREDYVSSYFAGETNLYGVTEPAYAEAEGWFDAVINLGQSRTKTIPTPNIFTAGPIATVEFAVAGASNYRPLNPDHHLQVQFAGNLIDTLYDGYSLIRINQQVGANSLNSAGTPFVFSSVNSLNSPTDRSTIAYISVKYPRVFNLGNRNNIMMELPASQGERTYIRFTGFNAAAADTVWIYNLTHNTRIRAFREDDFYNALIPNSTQSRKLYITTHPQTVNITSVRPVSTGSDQFARFTNYLSSGYFNSDYIIVTHRSLMTQAADYRNFRNSTGHKVLLADVDQLYHQFAYGIRKHPLAIRKFVQFLLQEYEQKPQYLFLIGKTRAAQAYRKNSSAYAASLVPSFGDPPSDVLLTSGLDGRGYAPALATGRLAARSSAHVTLYLNKVIQHYNARKEPKEWMKNILHFGGGSNINEQNILAFYLRTYANSMSNEHFGGHVRTFLKSSTDPIQINQSDSLRTLINNGVSFMTFFGHAAGIGFDISIDYPSEYNNYGKYPFLVANSCFAGDIFGVGVNSSEEFVLIEEKGVIGYLAATTASGASELNRFSNELFRQISTRNYGKPIGYLLRETVRSIQTSDPYLRNICFLNTLHGDPAVVLNAHDKADYMVDSRSIFFTPKEVTTEIDSFAVNIVATNLGKAFRDSMFVSLERRFPDGTTETLLRKVRTPFFKDTLTIMMPVDRGKGVGVNHFTVILDALNQKEELNKSNNLASQQLLIKSADVIPVFPARYAIVPSQVVTLKASTGDPFANEKSYVFQIDNQPDFKNPVSWKVSHKGGVIEWKPPITLSDSTVYFWRVSLDSIYNGEFNWRESSFQYIPGKTGWSQAHFSQFGNNRYNYVSYNRPLKRWDFINNINAIQAQTGVYPYIAWTEQFIRVNGVTVSIYSCISDGNGMYFSVFDPVSAAIQYNVRQEGNVGTYNSFYCFQRNAVETFDYFSTTEEWRARMRRFIDTIPEGHYILALSHKNHNAQNYPEDLYQAFESFGSGNIRNLVNNTPYMIFGRKGQPPGSANEVIGAAITSHIQLSDSIITNWNKGFILSELIGPASRWETINWQHKSQEQNSTDSVWLNIIGVTASGETDTLFTRIPSSQQSFDLTAKSGIERYPYLQLMVNMIDDVNRTPAQMQYWNVVYEGIPETALNPSLHFVLEKDTVPEGKPILFSTAIQNISNHDMDSLLIKYWVIDKNRNWHALPYPRQRRHPAGDIFTDTIQIPTKGLTGNNSLWIEVNPGNDQIEQHFFNNVGQIPFYVEKDKTNPLLDVTFDGMQIMDGDIVSAKPFINIRLSDENPYLALIDTTLVKVFLMSPGSTESQRIYFNSDGRENMRFYPAVLPQNQCYIEFEPHFESDGEYMLRVQATDKSMNESGKQDYVISFKVITQSTITEILNWPNPFSTATHFVFTLTGSELPSFMKIQILTITGKVVREIDMSELGPLRIGRNITSYAWDGTDQYGDRLGNGVYLYRVITNIDGKQIMQNQTQASKFFHEGFGKMYLMR